MTITILQISFALLSASESEVPSGGSTDEHEEAHGGGEPRQVGEYRNTLALMINVRHMTNLILMMNLRLTMYLIW